MPPAAAELNQVDRRGTLDFVPAARQMRSGEGYPVSLGPLCNQSQQSAEPVCQVVVLWAQEDQPTLPRSLRRANVPLPEVVDGAREGAAKLLATSTPDRVAATYDQGWVPPRGELGRLSGDLPEGASGTASWRIEYATGLEGRPTGAQLRFTTKSQARLQKLADTLAKAERSDIIHKNETPEEEHHTNDNKMNPHS